MAKTTYITIPEGLDLAYKKVIQSGDRFILPHIKVKRIFSSRVRRKGLTQKSLMVLLAPVWASFDQSVRDAWAAAAEQSDMTGWKLFVQDTSLRLANDLPGYATPDTLYQSRVGRMHVESPATGLTIVQLHPQSYYVNKKVTGTRSQYEPQLIQENLTLPVAISISYKSRLVAVGPEPRARFYVIVYSSYQGRTIENECVIDFNFFSDSPEGFGLMGFGLSGFGYLAHDGWIRDVGEIIGVIGLFRGYTAFVEINDAEGDLYFDNVEIVHTGMNWARDPFCNSIQTSFTKAFFQIPRNWAAEEITDGAYFRSVYHDQPV